MVLSATVLANPMEPEKALEVATSFWKSNAPKEKKSNILRLSTDNLMSKSGSRDNAEKIKAQYYLFTSDNDKSFVIVSGDDRLSPIVGYSFGNCNGEMPPALVEWLNEYSSYVDDVRTVDVYRVRNGLRQYIRGNAGDLSFYLVCDDQREQ